MAKIVDKDLMREKILTAAMVVFARDGFHTATIAAIAKQAGLGKGTLYLYFKNKEDLTVQLVRNYFDRIEAGLNVDNEVSTRSGFIDMLGKTLNVSAKQAASIPVFFEVFGPSFSTPEVRQTVAAFFDRTGHMYAKIIVDLQNCGEINQDLDANSLGRVLVSIVDGIVIHYGLFNVSSAQHKDMIKQALILFDRGLGVKFK